jgi:hypothetical protein
LISNSSEDEKIPCLVSDIQTTILPDIGCREHEYPPPRPNLRQDSQPQVRFDPRARDQRSAKDASVRQRGYERRGTIFRVDDDG